MLRHADHSSGHPRRSAERSPRQCGVQHNMPEMFGRLVVCITCAAALGLCGLLRGRMGLESMPGFGAHAACAATPSGGVYEATPELLRSGIWQLQRSVVVRYEYREADIDSKMPSEERLAAELPQLPLLRMNCTRAADACRAYNIATNAFVLYPNHGRKPVILADDFDNLQQYTSALRDAFAKLLPEVLPDAKSGASQFDEELANNQDKT